MADKYNERANNINAEQNGRQSGPENMLELIERERSQFNIDFKKGMRETFKAALVKHDGDTGTAFRHLYMVTTKHLALDDGFLFKIVCALIADAIYDELTDEQKESLRKDSIVK